MDGLYRLRNLEKLDISKNKISKLEGLKCCMKLKELYFDDQKTKNTTHFEDDSIIAISQSLRIFYCNDNNVENIDILGFLVALDTLQLRNNKIKSILDLERGLVCMKYLRSLDLRDNEVVKAEKFRDYVLMMALNLQELNFKNVLTTEREFLFKFHKIKQ